LVKVQSHLVAAADPVLDIEAVVGILAKYAEEIFYGQVSPYGAHVQLTRVEIGFKKRRVQIGSPDHDVADVIIGHRSFNHTFRNLNILSGLFRILLLAESSRKHYKKQSKKNQIGR